jgi:hypothetical protein
MTVSRHKARFHSIRYGAAKPLRKGMPYRRIIALCFIAPNNEYALHATKGYRWRRLPKNRNLLLEGLMQRLSNSSGQPLDQVKDSHTLPLS